MTADADPRSAEGSSGATDAAGSNAANAESSVSGRGPLFDRLSATVAIAGFLLLASNEAPFLDGVGVLRLTVAVLAVAALLSLLAFRLVGPIVLEPLWIGVGTAIFLSLPLITGLWFTGYYTAEWGWAVSLAGTLFGLGVAVRATQARLALS